MCLLADTSRQSKHILSTSGHKYVYVKWSTLGTLGQLNAKIHISKSWAHWESVASKDALGDLYIVLKVGHIGKVGHNGAHTLVKSGSRWESKAHWNTDQWKKGTWKWGYVSNCSKVASNTTTATTATTATNTTMQFASREIVVQAMRKLLTERLVTKWIVTEKSLFWGSGG